MPVCATLCAQLYRAVHAGPPRQGCAAVAHLLRQVHPQLRAAVRGGRRAGGDGFSGGERRLDAARVGPAGSGYGVIAGELIGE